MKSDVCGLFYGTTYRWYVYVADGSLSGGYGLSYYYWTVTFSAGLSSQENRFRGEGETSPLVPSERLPTDWLPNPKPYTEPGEGP